MERKIGNEAKANLVPLTVPVRYEILQALELVAGSKGISVEALVLRGIKKTLAGEGSVWWETADERGLREAVNKLRGT